MLLLIGLWVQKILEILFQLNRELGLLSSWEMYRSYGCPGFKLKLLFQERNQNVLACSKMCEIIAQFDKWSRIFIPRFLRKNLPCVFAPSKAFEETVEENYIRMLLTKTTWLQIWKMPNYLRIPCILVCHTNGLGEECTLCKLTFKPFLPWINLRICLLNGSKSMVPII